MSEILVTASQLHSKSEELKSLNDSFKAQVNSLVESESRLISMWDGDAKEAFHGAFMHDKDLMEKFYNLIARYVCVLDSMADAYEQAEAQNVSIAGKKNSSGGVTSFISGAGLAGAINPPAMVKYAAPQPFWNSGEILSSALRDIIK